MPSCSATLCYKKMSQLCSIIFELVDYIQKWKSFPKYKKYGLLRLYTTLYVYFQWYKNMFLVNNRPCQGGAQPAELRACKQRAILADVLARGNRGGDFHSKTDAAHRNRGGRGDRSTTCRVPDTHHAPKHQRGRWPMRGLRVAHRAPRGRTYASGSAAAARVLPNNPCCVASTTATIAGCCKRRSVVMA